MKHPHTPLAILILGAMAPVGFTAASANAQTGQPVVITPPAVQDGSNWSRAPFPAKRRFDDVKAPDGVPVDALPPNTPATNTEPAPPAPSVVILQPAPATTTAVASTGATATNTASLSPTGRVTVATSLDAATFAPTIRAATMANRDQVIADIESRVSASEQAVMSMSTSATGEAKRAMDDAKAKAKALRASIEKARTAADKNWDKMRSQLASDFDAYAAAVARIDSAAR